jgi:hypothetical protein
VSVRPPRRRKQDRFREGQPVDEGPGGERSAKSRRFGKGSPNQSKGHTTGRTPIDGFPAPEALEITPRAVKAGDTWFRTLAIVGWPREVSAGWLQPLLSWRGAADIALYFEPVPNDAAARHLQKQRARFSSSLAKGGVSDPMTEVAASDAEDIARAIARGESRLFRLGLYITLRAATLEALDAETYKVKVLCSSLLLDARPTTYRALEGWLSTLPLGADQIKLRRTFDTRAGADCFPFATGEMVGHPTGILFGRGVSRTRTEAAGGGGGSPVFVDRFALPNHNMLILASSGAGKALALDTPLPTPDGWTTMGQVAVGDQVINQDGCPVTVTGTSDFQFGRTCYEVVFDDGSTIVADADHLWVTQTAASRHRPVPGPPLPITTEQIKATLRTVTSRAEANHAVPVCCPLDLPAQELPIDPYLLGAWLGDGSSHTPAITVGNGDIQILEEIRAQGYTVQAADQVRPNVARYYIGKSRNRGELSHCSKGHPRTEENTYRPKNSKTGNAQRYCKPCMDENTARRRGRAFVPASTEVVQLEMFDHLKALRLLRNKHIPAAYFRGSQRQRLALLQGLMDTDGTVDTRGRCEFTSTNERLAEGVRELLCSFGIKAAVRKGTARLHGIDCGPKYRVCFTTTLPVFRLKRKVERLPTLVRPTQKYRYVVDVRPVPSVPVRCIVVDTPSHLFLAGPSMIPTHNSYAAKALTGRSALQGDEVLIVDPDDEYVRLTQALGGQVIRDPTQAPSEDARVVCYALGESDEARLHEAVGQALGSVWLRVDKGPVRRRQVVVDEAYLMLRENPEASYLLWALIKRSRKRLCGLTIITQDLADVLSTTLGESIINNASIHLLLRQTEKAIDGIGSAFGLSEGERSFLVAAPQGQGLLLVAGERAALKVVTSEMEHGLCVTDPASQLVTANR